MIFVDCGARLRTVKRKKRQWYCAASGMQPSSTARRLAPQGALECYTMSGRGICFGPDEALPGGRCRRLVPPASGTRLAEHGTNACTVERHAARKTRYPFRERTQRFPARRRRHGASACTVAAGVRGTARPAPHGGAGTVLTRALYKGRRGWLRRLVPPASGTRLAEHYRPHCNRRRAPFIEAGIEAGTLCMR
jgi:hypothetical protein